MGGNAATNLDLQRNYPADFTEENNTCSTTLAAGASCSVQGSLIPSNPGNYEVAADLFYAESVTPASVSTSTNAIEIIVTGAVTTPLPDPTVVGESFPVVFAYTNNSDLPATSVNITTNYPPGFIQQSDNCTGTLNAHSSCTLQGTFTPATAGDFTVGVSLTYAESNNPVPLSTSTTADIGASGIVGDVTTPLPATTSIDVSYPVVFTYTNEGSVTATGLNITSNYPPEFTQQSNSCSGSLGVGSVCTVTGSLLPTSVGNYTVDVSLSYDQSINPVPLSTTTSAIAVAITGTVSTPLPAISAINTSYPVIFSYKNNSSVAASGMVLTPNYPAGFTENTNTCASGTLAAGQTCSIQGSFIPTNEGNYTVATSLTYTGAPAAIPLSTSTSTLEFVLTGDVSTPLPGTLELGNEYPVVFTYTNASPLPATNLVFTPNYPADFMPETNTCTSTLASNSACAVSGTLIPSSNTAPGPITVGLNLAYFEGSPSVLTTSSEVESIVVITGTVVEALPPTETASATPLPVVFQYTNDGNAPATGLNLTTNYPPEFTQDSNTCTGTLGVDASCQITGNLDISATGNYSVGVTLNTNEVAPVALITQTSIIAAEVIGSVVQALPGSTVINTKYSVTFLFINEGAVDATTVNIVTNYPADFQQTSDTCGATLAAGASCRVQGTLTPTSEGSQTVELTFQYAEGSDIPLSTSTIVGTLVLQGIVQQGFPDVASANTAYPLTFKYTNPGPGNATSLTISSTPGLDITSNTCTGTLPANSSCTIEASFTPTQIGAYAAGVTLSYNQGEDIPLNTYTVVGNSLFIAGGGEGFLRTTPNWSKWTTRDNANNVNLTGIAFSPQLQRYVMVGNYNSSGVKGFLQFTRDGISFNDYAFPSPFLPLNIIWNPDLSQFLTVGGNGGIASSVDGLNWITQTSPVNTTLYSTSWSPQQHQYVVVGANGTILTSLDGIDWQLQTSGVGDILTAVAWSPSLERYVVSTSANYVLNSTDGTIWNNPGANIEFIAQSVTWSPTLAQFALVGNNTYIATSSDGQQWQKQQSGTTKVINDVIWFSYLNKFYAVGTNTNVYNSATGLNKWDNKSLTLIDNYSINAVAAGAVVG
ncbi:choice-of-anchor D domain-containing protein [Rickettsiella endosymbiont of Xylota segnis]|uniref:choice-of-anchor D domain-containing protein n=1 Tax=Rickettsiella endosymbiont of Xylota segnis TaxID=3066238 RepID=UPI0030CD46F1